MSAVNIFLSYRRSDVGGHADASSTRWCRRLGTTHVFQDVSAIAPGQDFSAAINTALDRPDAVLAVIVGMAGALRRAHGPAC